MDLPAAPPRTPHRGGRDIFAGDNEPLMPADEREFDEDEDRAPVRPDQAVHIRAPHTLQQTHDERQARMCKRRQHTNNTFTLNIQ